MVPISFWKYLARTKFIETKVRIERSKKKIEFEKDISKKLYKRENKK